MTEFPRVGLFSKGYDCAQVDAFFEDARRAYEGGVPPEQFSSEQVRLATFELKNRGYNIDAVDAAMNRLEAAFVKRDRADSVAAEGEAAWYDRVADRATTLYPRLQRPRGERFAHGGIARRDGVAVHRLRLHLRHDRKNRLLDEIGRRDIGIAEAEIADVFLPHFLRSLPAVLKDLADRRLLRAEFPHLFRYHYAKPSSFSQK